MWEEYYKSENGERIVHIKPKENKSISQMPFEITLTQHQTKEDMLLHAEVFVLASEMYEDT